MEIIPTGLFRQMTHEIRAQRLVETKMPTDLAPVASPQKPHFVSEREVSPEVLELINRREAYLRAFELFSGLFDALSQTAEGAEPPLKRLRHFAALAMPLFHELSGLLTIMLNGTHLAATAPARLNQSLQAERSLGSVGFQLDPRLLLTFDERLLGSNEGIAIAFEEACHGPQALAATLVELAGEAWGNALVPDNEQSGHVWAAHARQQWLGTDLQGRLRLFGIILRKMRLQSSRFEDLAPPRS